MPKRRSTRSGRSWRAKARGDQTGRRCRFDRPDKAGIGRYRIQHRRGPSRSKPRSPCSSSFGILEYSLHRLRPLTLSLTLDKAMAKRILMSQNVPTPGFKKIERIEDLDSLDLRYPLFVKLCYEGSSKGFGWIRKYWIPILEKKTKELLNIYGSPVLVEEFVKGPEFTVGILGNEDPVVLGVMQIEITGKPPEESIYSLEIKREWEEKVRYHCPPSIDQSLLKKIEEVALRSYRALECRDVSRVDIRWGKTRPPIFWRSIPPGSFSRIRRPCDHGKRHGWIMRAW